VAPPTCVMNLISEHITFCRSKQPLLNQILCACPFDKRKSFEW